MNYSLHGSRQPENGVVAVEACALIPIAFLTFLIAFAIAQSYFISSRMVRIATTSAIALRAVSQSEDPIVYSPAYGQLRYNKGHTPVSAQKKWYEVPAPGISRTNPIHMEFLNLLLGQFSRIAPDQMMPPRAIKNGANYKTIYDPDAYEIRLENVGADTKISLKAKPSLLEHLFNVLGISTLALNPRLLESETTVLFTGAAGDPTNPDGTRFMEGWTPGVPSSGNPPWRIYTGGATTTDYGYRENTPVIPPATGGPSGGSGTYSKWGGLSETHTSHTYMMMMEAPVGFEIGFGP